MKRRTVIKTLLPATGSHYQLSHRLTTQQPKSFGRRIRKRELHAAKRKGKHQYDFIPGFHMWLRTEPSQCAPLMGNGEDWSESYMHTKINYSHKNYGVSKLHLVTQRYKLYGFIWISHSFRTYLNVSPASARRTWYMIQVPPFQLQWNYKIISCHSF